MRPLLAERVDIAPLEVLQHIGLARGAVDLDPQLPGEGGRLGAGVGSRVGCGIGRLRRLCWRLLGRRHPLAGLGALVGRRGLGVHVGGRLAGRGGVGGDFAGRLVRRVVFLDDGLRCRVGSGLRHRLVGLGFLRRAHLGGREARLLGDHGSVARPLAERPAAALPADGERRRPRLGQLQADEVGLLRQAEEIGAERAHHVAAAAGRRQLRRPPAQVEGMGVGAVGPRLRPAAVGAHLIEAGGVSPIAGSVSAGGGGADGGDRERRGKRKASPATAKARHGRRVAVRPSPSPDSAGRSILRAAELLWNMGFLLVYIRKCIPVEFHFTGS